MKQQTNTPLNIRILLNTTSSITEAISRIAAKYGDQVAIKCSDQQLTYTELHQTTNQLAQYLIRKGICISSRIGIYIKPSLEAILAIIATLKTGACYVPIDTNYPEKRIEYIIDDSNIDILLTQKGLDKLRILQSVDKIFLDSSDSDWSMISQMSKITPMIKTCRDNLAYIIYTSGSTGNPKGVLIPHHNVLSLIESCLQVFQLNENDTWTQFHSIAFDFSVWEIFGALLTGAKLVIVKQDIRKSIFDFHRLVINEKISVLSQTPQIFNQLIHEDEYYAKNNKIARPCNHLNYIIFGGEKLKINMLEPWMKRYGCLQPQLVNMYGITETTVHTTYHIIQYPDLDSDLHSPIGRTLPNSSAYVVDENMELVNPGENGELYISGDRIAKGYLNLPKLTAQKFVNNPWGKGKIYKSGDIATALENDCFDYVGRSDHQIKLRGYRIELGEIANQLMTHKNIKDAYVFDRKDAIENVYIAAYLILYKSQHLTPKQITEFLDKKIPNYMLPSAYIILQNFPLTINGKVDRNRLPEPKREEFVLDHEFKKAETATQINLTYIWQNLLGIKKIGILDNFFELGGNSILLMKLKFAIQEQYNFELSLSEMFENANIKSLSHTIDCYEPKEIKITRIKKKATPSQLIPLSYTQESIWPITQLENVGATYQVPFIIRFQGQLNVNCLEKALHQIIHRHSVFRTKIYFHQLGMRQSILQNINFVLNQFDLTSIEKSKRRIELNKQIKLKSSEISDLESGRLICATLFKVYDDNYTLLLNIHHIIFDLWSISILLNELSELYKANHKGITSPLDPLPIQYADYCLQIRKDLGMTHFQEMINYWSKQLENTPNILELPLDHERTHEMTFKGDNYHFHLPKSIVNTTKQLAKKVKTSLFVISLAAYSLFLRRYTNQTDIVVGSPIQNRYYQDVDKLIGFFTDVLPLRCTVIDENIVIDYIKHIKNTIIDAFKYQQISFHKLIDELNIERIPGINPLIQTLLVVTHIDEKDRKFDTLQAKYRALSNNTAKYTLTLFIQFKRNGMHLNFEYNNDLFKRSTIKKFAKHFRYLFCEFVKSPNSILTDVHMMEQHERNILIEMGRSNYATYPDQSNIIDLTLSVIQSNPDRIAVKDEKRQLNYHQLDMTSNELARQIQEIGVRHNDVVALCVQRCVDFCIGVLAILKCGATYLPIDEDTPLQRIQTILTNSDAKLLVVNNKVSLDLDISIFTIPKYNEYEMDNSTKVLRIDNHPDDPAYIIFTSGSTGVPKGVVQTHRTLVNLISWQNKHIPHSYRVALYASFEFDVATQTLFFSLISRNEMYIVPKKIKADPFALLKFIEKNKINTLFIPPTVLSGIAMGLNTDNNISCLKYIIVAGDVLNITAQIRNLFDRIPNCQLINQYGPTETHVITYYKLTTLPQSWPNLPPIGMAIDNTELYVLNDFLYPVPLGVTGELYVSGVMLAKGYINEADLTSERFINNPYGKNPDDKLYRTGDLVRYTKHGQLQYIGRKDRQVKIRGYRIELSSIEVNIENLSEVKYAAAMVKQDQQQHNILVAYVTLKSDAKITSSNIIKQLSNYIPKHMLPQRVIILDEMPMLNSGKINRHALPDVSLNELTSSIAYEPPKTQLEKTLSHFWEELLELERVGIKDNFFELGGHSLLATKLLLKIKQHFDIKIPLNKFFSEPSIITLCQLIETSEASSDKLIESEHINKQIYLDAQLSNSIQPLPRLRKVLSQPIGIFITGVTGFLGIYLLHNLVHSTNCNIYCLVRASNKSHAGKRISESLEEFGFENDESNPRIIPILGDLSQPMLGMSNKDYKLICSDVDLIIHNGCQVNHIYDYRMLRAANVLSTLQIIKISATEHPKRIHFISTSGAINDRDEQQNFLEQFPSDQKVNLDGGYLITKWVSERLLQQAHSRGFAVNIYRPSHILSDSISGIIRYKDHHLSLLIKGCMQFNAAPTKMGMLDALPIDFIANNLIKFILQINDMGKVFNMCSPKPIPWETIFEYLKNYGYKFKILDYEIWKDQYLTHAKQDNALYPLLSLYLSHKETVEQHEAVIKINNYQTLLNKLKISVPTLNHNYFYRYFDYISPWIRR